MAIDWKETLMPPKIPDGRSGHYYVTIHLKKCQLGILFAENLEVPEKKILNILYLFVHYCTFYAVTSRLPESNERQALLIFQCKAPMSCPFLSHANVSRTCVRPLLFKRWHNMECSHECNFSRLRGVTHIWSGTDKYKATQIIAQKTFSSSILLVTPNFHFGVDLPKIWYPASQ